LIFDSRGVQGSEEPERKSIVNTGT
jgi:hypothetical protein